MSEIPPTPEQRRLVDIGIVIQFYLAAIGHVAVWLWMFYSLYHPQVWLNPDADGSYGEGLFITEIFVWQGIPISFGILVAVYILFRVLLAYTKFTTALSVMISLNVIHSLLMCAFIITPVRLLIPTILYGRAYYLYYQQNLKPNPEISESFHDS